MKRRKLGWWCGIMLGTMFCVSLFAMVQRELGRLEAHVGTIVALDCFISAGEFAPNDQVIKHLYSWLDCEERFVTEWPGIFSIGSYGHLRNHGAKSAHHARDMLKSMERTIDTADDAVALPSEVEESVRQYESTKDVFWLRAAFATNDSIKVVNVSGLISNKISLLARVSPCYARFHADADIQKVYSHIRPPNGYDSGTDPEAVSDPIERREYKKRIEANRRRSNDLRAQMLIRKKMAEVGVLCEMSTLSGAELSSLLLLIESVNIKQPLKDELRAEIKGGLRVGAY